MLRQILVGGAASAVNIGIHALVITIVVHVVRRTGADRKTDSSAYLIMVMMIPTVLVLMTTHTLEVIVWSITYFIVGAAPDGTDLVDFAFVNYTTLGYGDVVPVARWRLLGPITAMNGVLLFGWSTAFLFEVLRRTLGRGE
jgi:Ion channel